MTDTATPRGSSTFLLGGQRKSLRACPATRTVCRLVAGSLRLLALAFAVGEPAETDAEIASVTGPRVSVVRLDYEGLACPVPSDQELSLAQTQELVRAALRELGGMEAFVSPEDEWVVIKPNIVKLIDERGSGGTTDPYVVWSVARLVHEVNAGARITIAEGAGGWISPGHPQAGSSRPIADGSARCGFREIAADPALADAQVDFIDLNFEEAQLHAGVATGDQYWLPRIVRQCDVFIDVPVLKAIGAVGMTCAMKNLVGTMPGMKYGWPKTEGLPFRSGNPGLPNHHGQELGEMIVDIASIGDVDLTIVDAIVGLERGRVPAEGGRARRLNTIVAGTDLVAVDRHCREAVGRAVGWTSSSPVACQGGGWDPQP